MSADHIEYHIKFPAGSPKLLSLSGDDDFVHVRDKEERNPVVFLFGWIGCLDKNLSRYSDIYDDHGCITVRCCVPLQILMFNHYKYPKMASRLLDLITDMSLDEHPIFFHIFSNGGCYLYQYVINEMILRDMKLDIRGCLYDSAPGKMRHTSVFKTIMTVPMGIKPVRMIFALFACVWMFFLNIGMFFLNKFVSPSYLTGDVFQNLLRAPTDIPQLFICSADDKFVMVDDIDEFAEKRKSFGVPVTKCRFDSSPHVMHLVAHREEYLRQILHFLKTCLQHK